MENTLFSLACFNAPLNGAVMEQTALVAKMRTAYELTPGRCQMAKCPRCKSEDVDAPQPTVDAGVAISVRAGGITAAALTIAALEPIAVVPLIAGPTLRGCGG
jgi:hypothetical protein